MILGVMAGKSGDFAFDQILEERVYSNDAFHQFGVIQRNSISSGSLITQLS